MPAIVRADETPAEAVPVVEPAQPVELVVAPAPVPQVGPDPQRVWETTHLERTPLGGGWIVRAGDHTFDAVEFAAITGDTHAVEAFRRQERGAYRGTRTLVVAGSVLASLSVAELVAWRATTEDDPERSEDHLWRSGVLAVSASVPLAFCKVPVRFAAGRRAQIAASYTAEEADTRIASFNVHLREQLGLASSSTVASPPTTAVILPPAPEAP